MIPSMMQQLASVSHKAPVKQLAQADDKRQRVTELLRWLEHKGPATMDTIMQKHDMTLTTARGYMRELKRDRKVVTWRAGNTAWYGVVR